MSTTARHGELTERLLDSWLNLSMDLWNERFVSDLSYNESLVCHLLYKQRRNHPEAPYMTLMQLSHETGILKSQMNKTLTALEENGFILRERSTEDKRIVYITLKEENLTKYHSQHAHILEVVDTVIDGLGDRAEDAIEIFDTIGAKISELTEKNSGREED